MSLLSQIIQLLSEPPGNIVYHLVTLFALQAVFGMALSQWRRDRDDQVAWHTLIAAAAIFGARLGLLLLNLVWQNNVTLSSTYLPPLSQAGHSLAPQPEDLVALGARRHLQGHLPVEGRHGELGAQRRLNG